MRSESTSYSLLCLWASEIELDTQLDLVSISWWNKVLFAGLSARCLSGPSQGTCLSTKGLDPTVSPHHPFLTFTSSFGGRGARHFSVFHPASSTAFQRALSLWHCPGPLGVRAEARDCEIREGGTSAPTLPTGVVSSQLSSPSEPFRQWPCILELFHFSTPKIQSTFL